MCIETTQISVSSNIYNFGKSISTWIAFQNQKFWVPSKSNLIMDLDIGIWSDLMEQSKFDFTMINDWTSDQSPPSLYGACEAIMSEIALGMVCILYAAHKKI